MRYNGFKIIDEGNGMETWRTKITGVTFENEDGVPRQRLLKRLAEKYGSYHDFEFELEKFEYEGKPAYRVLSERGDIGTLPQEVADALDHKEKSGCVYIVTESVIYGGPDEEDPDKKYGARIELSVYNPDRRKATGNHLVSNSEPVRVIIEEKASIRKKNTALVLCFVLGIFGGHRFYCGKIGSAIVNLIYGIVWFRLFVLDGGFVDTGSPLGMIFLAILPLIWLVDIIRIVTGNYRDRDGKKLE